MEFNRIKYLNFKNVSKDIHILKVVFFFMFNACLVNTLIIKPYYCKFISLSIRIFIINFKNIKSDKHFSLNNRIPYNYLIYALIIIKPLIQCIMVTYIIAIGNAYIGYNIEFTHCYIIIPVNQLLKKILIFKQY